MLENAAIVTVCLGLILWAVLDSKAEHDRTVGTAQHGPVCPAPEVTS